MTKYRWIFWTLCSTTQSRKKLRYGFCLKVIKEGKKKKKKYYFLGIFRQFFLFWKVVIKVAHTRCLWSMNSALYLHSKSLDSSSIQGE